MKNTEKINVNLRIPTPNDGIEASATNLRSAAGNSLEAVGHPAPIGEICEGGRFAGYDIRNNRTYYFAESDSCLKQCGYSSGCEFYKEEKTLCASNGIRQIAPIGDFAVLSAPNGIEYLYYGADGYEYLGGYPIFPAIAATVTDKAELTETLPAMTLKGEYQGWSGTLIADDASLVSKTAAAAAKRLYGKIRANCQCRQPMIVRTALRLWDGTLLWSGEASSAGSASSTPSALARATMLTANSFRIESCELSIGAWKPAVAIANTGIGKWAKLIKAIEIYGSEAMPDDTTVTLRCETKQTGSPEYYLRIEIGKTAAQMADRSIAQSGRFRLLASITDIKSFIDGHIDAPGIALVADGAGGCLASSTYAIDIPPADATTDYTPPHPHFAPKTAITVGNRCFAGDIETTLPEPPRYESLCNPDGFTAASATATVAVEIPSGEETRISARTELLSAWSRKLNGIAAYPDSRATRITVSVTAEGKNYLWKGEMLPSACGTFAYASCTESNGWELQPADNVPAIASNATKERNSSSLLVSAIGNPLLWQRCPKASNRGIRAIAPAYGYGSSWQLGRHSAYLFASEGVYLLSFNAKGECLGGSLLSKHTAAAQSLVATAAGAIVFINENGQLCRLSGSKAIQTGITATNAYAIGNCIRYGETWIGTDAGIIIAEESGGFYHRDSGLTIENTQGNMLLTSGNSIFTAEEETDGQSTGIMLLTPPMAVPIGKRAKAAIWDTAADTASLRFSVYGENGHSCCGQLISGITATGSIGSPIFHRFAAPFFRTLRLGISGTVAPRTLLHPAAILI